MSLTTRNYSREIRSSKYYSRSSSSLYRSNNNHYCRSRSFIDIDRPLSERLIEKDNSCGFIDWDEPFFWDSDFYDPFWKYRYCLRRTIPITYRTYELSPSTRSIPVRYISSLNHRNQRKKSNSDHLNTRKIHDESSIRRENRISTNDWPPIEGPPTRKRTSMTIFVQQPYLPLSEIPYYQQTPQTPTYPQSVRMDYY